MDRQPSLFTVATKRKNPGKSDVLRINFKEVFCSTNYILSFIFSTQTRHFNLLKWIHLLKIHITSSANNEGIQYLSQQASENCCDGQIQFRKKWHLTHSDDLLLSEYLKKVIVDFLLGWQKSPPIAAMSLSPLSLTHNTLTVLSLPKCVCLPLK